MPNFKIFDNGTQINRIVANEEFCRTYCQKHGYTYEVEPEPEPQPEPEPKPDPKPADSPVTWSSLASAIKEGVNEV